MSRFLPVLIIKTLRITNVPPTFSQVVMATQLLELGGELRGPVYGPVRLWVEASFYICSPSSSS